MQRNVLVSRELASQLNEPDQIEQFYSAVLQQKDPRELFGSEKKKKSLFSVRIVSDYHGNPKKYSVQDFVGHFNARYRALAKILQQRPELQNITSIARLHNKRERETVSLIGIVSEKHITKNENVMLTVEDPTGNIRVVISKASKAYPEVKDTLLDEVIGIVGSSGKNVVFANSIIVSDIPVKGDIKHAPDETYAVILSDIHVGSKNFLEKSFQKFLAWIKGEAGTPEQREIASKVGYIFVVGDLVDGVGIFPSQEKELAIPDIYEQYQHCAALLKQIPSSINLIICPGNHDALRLSEPQPQLPKDFAKPIWELPNAHLVSNPSIVNIHSSDRFPGFDCLLYHGYSYSYYSDNVESIRTSGRLVSDRTDLVMKYVLQRRHLAPTHTSNLYLPDNMQDELAITMVPDFFFSGHIHKLALTNYRGVDCICGSCWQSISAFQEKMGHTPEPGRVPVINLQTRAIKILNF